VHAWGPWCTPGAPTQCGCVPPSPTALLCLQTQILERIFVVYFWLMCAGHFTAGTQRMCCHKLHIAIVWIVYIDVQGLFSMWHGISSPYTAVPGCTPILATASLHRRKFWRLAQCLSGKAPVQVLSHHVLQACALHISQYASIVPDLFCRKSR